jgi:hypothetical protein
LVIQASPSCLSVKDCDTLEFMAAAPSPFDTPLRDTQVAWPALAIAKLWKMG